ncbi:hypothetical protein Bbelb_336360 [Branchiostoma belcheri]|nr:hypothetical protein Bbelb_336360 [Branchiostoma belcheri]
MQRGKIASAQVPHTTQPLGSHYTKLDSADHQPSGLRDEEKQFRARQVCGVFDGGIPVPDSWTSRLPGLSAIACLGLHPWVTGSKVTVNFCVLNLAEAVRMSSVCVTGSKVPLNFCVLNLAAAVRPGTARFQDILVLPPAAPTCLSWHAWNGPAALIAHSSISRQLVSVPPTKEP